MQYEERRDVQYEDLLKANTPHLAVRWRVNEKGEEQFEWGGSGSIPPMSVLGAIAKTQQGLLRWDEVSGRMGMHTWQSAGVLAIVWRTETRSTDWYCDPNVNVEAMVGMLETIGALLLTGVGRRAAAQQVPIFGPDGQPLRR